jgi:serine protease Do
MRKFITFGPALVVLITTLVTLVAAPAAVRLVGYASTDATIVQARQALDGENILKQIDRAVRAVADSVEPSVVHIATEEGRGRGMIRTSQGSGWVYDADGHIVTNSHVVRGAARVVVQFYDGRAVDAEVVGEDATTDIAVLKAATTEGLFPIRRATGLELHQGDRVYAFGSPFGFKFSMSEGIVSGLGRDPRALRLDDGYTNFIQTDAAVNPGNSGGPLVNVEGRLVGMNVAIATAPRVRGPGDEPETGQNSGISFAIPLATIERVAEQLINGGVVTRGFLGINHPISDDVNGVELNRLGFRGRGVLVAGVQKNGPADKAGLQVNDVITRIGGQSVIGVPSLRSAITNNGPGDKVPVEVWRNGETVNLIVELGRLITESEKREAARVVARFGLNDIAETGDGQLVVTEVRVPSPAYQAGMRPEQRITGVGAQPVKNIEEFFTALASAGLHQGRDVKLDLETRAGQKREITVSGK